MAGVAPSFDADVVNVRTSLGALNAARATVPGAQWSGTQLTRLIGNAGQALADAAKLQTARARSGSMLRSQVATIRSEVDRQLIATNPKPDAILNTVSSAVAGWQQLMSGLTTQSASLLQAVGVAAAQPANATDLLADQLSGYLVVLQGDLVAVKDVSASQSDFSKCTVANVTAPFVLVGPSVKTFQPGKSFTYQTSGGTAPLTASLLGGLTAKDLTVTVSGTSVTAIAGQPTQARQGNLLITDATGRTLTPQISILAAAATAGPQPQPQPQQTASAATFSVPRLDLVRTVQASGKTPVPGLGDFSGPGCFNLAEI